MAASVDRGTLHSRTLALIRESKIPLPVIYKETNLPFYWLKKFAGGEIRDPSVNRVQFLYEFLSQTKLGI